VVLSENSSRGNQWQDRQVKDKCKAEMFLESVSILIWKQLLNQK